MIEPTDLLVAAIDPLRPLKQFTMAHPKLQAMHEEVRQAIREPGGASLLFLLGPTGVGKTTLVARLMQQLTREQMPELAQARFRLAVAGMEAEAPPHGNYDFKQHFKR
jgi:replication-associated recombination protein RarA